MIETYWQLFLAFFIPNIVGYGGGPAIIPLIEAEVVTNYAWLSTQEFSEVLALGNSLPSPIATKMAGFIGYDVGGWIGAVVAVSATIIPSLILMIALLGLLYRYRDSIKVKSMSAWVRPTIAIMMALLTWKFASNSFVGVGVWHTLFLVIASYLLLERFKVHPALVISASLAYGGLLL